MATIHDYRDAFDPGNVFTIPRMYLTHGHFESCTDPMMLESGGLGGDECPCPWESDEPTAVISAQPVGGGDPGKAYAGRWFYELTVDGEVVESTDDFTSGTPMTSREAARAIVDHLACTVEDKSLNMWPEAAMVFARKNLERLQDFAHGGDEA